MATPPSGPLPLIEGLHKRIGLRNGGLHGANQARNLRFHCHSLLPYGGNRPRIQVVFEQEHLSAEGSEDRRHRRFRALHRAYERRVALPGLCQLAGTRLPQGLMRILRSFGFPFLKERLGHLLDGRDALVGSVSKVEMTTPMTLICKALFPSISTFETPPAVCVPFCHSPSSRRRCAMLCAPDISRHH